MNKRALISILLILAVSACFDGCRPAKRPAKETSRTPEPVVSAEHVLIINGEPAYVVNENGKSFVRYNGEDGPHIDYIVKLFNVGGKLCYVGDECDDPEDPFSGSQHMVYEGKIGPPFEQIIPILGCLSVIFPWTEMLRIGDVLYYTAYGSDRNMMYLVNANTNETVRHHTIHNLIDFNGKILFIAHRENDEGYAIMHGGKTIVETADEREIESAIVAGGKLAYKICETVEDDKGNYTTNEEMYFGNARLPINGSCLQPYGKDIVYIGETGEGGNSEQVLVHSAKGIIDTGIVLSGKSCSFRPAHNLPFDVVDGNLLYTKKKGNEFFIVFDREYGPYSGAPVYKIIDGDLLIASSEEGELTYDYPGKGVIQMNHNVTSSLTYKDRLLSGIPGLIEDYYFSGGKFVYSVYDEVAEKYSCYFEGEKKCPCNALRDAQVVGEDVYMAVTRSNYGDVVLYKNYKPVGWQLRDNGDGKFFIQGEELCFVGWSYFVKGDTKIPLER